MSDSVLAFIAMGGYGGYVWSCYAAALAMQGGFMALLWRRRRRLLREQQP